MKIGSEGVGALHRYLMCLIRRRKLLKSLCRRHNIPYVSRTRTRNNTIPNGTKANAAGLSGLCIWLEEEGAKHAVCFVSLSPWQNPCLWQLWSRKTFSVVAIRTIVSHYLTSNLDLAYSFLKFVELVKMWTPQAPNFTTFSPFQLFWDWRF